MAEEFEQPVDETTASQRHWLYGFNAGVLVVAGLAVMIILAVLCQTEWVQRHTKFDWSSAGLNSLSGGTRKMLVQVDSKPEKYQLWSLFTDASDEIKRDNPGEAAKQAAQRQQIRDLLDQYKRASGKITWEDRGDAAKDDIEKQIRDKYQAEFKPYQEAVDAYDPLVKKLSEFMKNEAAAIGAFAQKQGTPADEAQEAAILQAQFASLPAQLEQDQRLIHREVDGSTLPDWGALKQKISDTLDEIQPVIDFLGDGDKLKAAMEGKKIGPALGAYFTEANAKYKVIATELKGYKVQLDDLKPLKVQDVLSSLGRNTVVVMGENTAKVISNYDLFTESTSGRAGDESVTFNGEQAISSALYAMANPNKVKVVFVTAAPGRLLEEMYTDMKKGLEDLNFEVLEWSPAGNQQPGSPPEGGGPPPASGKSVVWIVFPPETPSNPMMMMSQPNAGPVIAATKTHLVKGGNVLFMADPSGGFMGPSAYAYADLIKDYGIEVDSKYTILHSQEQPDPDTGQVIRQNSPFVGLDPNRPALYAKSEITTPVEGLPTVFGPMLTNQGQSGACTVVKVLKPVPSGVEAMELVTTPYDESFWATADPAPTAKYDATKDLKSPVPLMVVAVKDKGKKAPDGSLDEQRVGVLGAKMLGSDFFTKLTVDAITASGQRVRFPRFPGNAELMKNTVLWMSGYENMIAVSARANRPASIGAVTPGKWWTVFAFVVLAPVVVLLAGWLVWAARHR